MFPPRKDEEFENEVLGIVLIEPNDDGTETVHMGMVQKPKL